MPQWLNWPLAQKQQILTICPATYHAEDIGKILDRGGPTAWLKAAPVLPQLIRELKARGMLDRAALVEKLGRPDERPRGIPGSIPSLRAPPPGCRFHPRCSLAMPVCRELRPVLAGDGAHRTACHAVNPPT